MNPRQIEYLLSLRDDVSGKFSKIQNNIERGIQRTSRRLDQFSRSFRAVSAGIIALVGSIGFAATSTASYADEIDKMSQRTQLGTEFLQEMRFVTGQAGVEFQSLERTMDSFVRRIPQLEAGTSESARAWEQLGINLHDAEGNLRSTGELYPELIRQLAGMENETRRNVIATQLLGRGASELIPLLNLSSRELDQLTQRAHEMGAVMDEDAIAAAVEFNDKLDELKTEFQAVVREAGSSFIPMITESIVPIIREQLIPMIRRGIEFIVRLTEAFSNMSPGAQNATLAIIGLTAAASPAAFALSRLLTIVPLLTAAFHAMLGPLGLIAGAISLAVYWTIRQRNRAAELNEELLKQNRYITDLAESYDQLTAAQLTEEMTRLSAEVMRMQGRIEELNDVKRQSHGLDAESAFELQVLSERTDDYIRRIIELRQRLDELRNAAMDTFDEVIPRVEAMINEGVLMPMQRIEMEVPEILERVEGSMTEVAWGFSGSIRMMAGMMTQEFQQWANFALDATHTMTDAFRTASDNRIAAIQEEMTARIEAIDRQLEREDLAEDERQRLRDQREVAEREMERRIARERNQMARRERTLAVIQSIINTALAVTRALPNIPLAAAIGALGAAQTGIIRAQQIPSMHTGGTAIFDAPRDQEALVRVRGQERLQVEPLDDPGRLQSRTVNLTMNFHSPVSSKKMVREAVIEGLRETGLSVNEYLNYERGRVDR